MPHTFAERKQLESLMDRMSMVGLMEALSHICSEKADRTRRQPQIDPDTKDRWNALATGFDHLAATIDDPYFPNY